MASTVAQTWSCTLCSIQTPDVLDLLSFEGTEVSLHMHHGTAEPNLGYGCTPAI